jgi:putative transposase
LRRLRGTTINVKCYERRLPHWDLVGEPLFVTFRLCGSLPANRVFPPETLTSGRAFVAMDRLLDHARSGPLYLRQPEIAQMVVQALSDSEVRFRRYDLHAYIVMANHVHLLVTPHVTLRDWLGPLEGFTGHEAIRMLGLHSTPFWQDESYDHLVRDGGFERIKRYIENNPVKAGIVNTLEEFPWSSAATPRGAALLGCKPGFRPAVPRGSAERRPEGLPHLTGSSN